MFGFFIDGDDLLLHRLDGGTQAAFMAGRLVFMNDLLVGNAVNDANVLIEGALCSSLVATVHGLENLLDRSTQRGTQARIMSALLDCLASAFSSLCSICHEYSRI